MSGHSLHKRSRALHRQGPGLLVLAVLAAAYAFLPCCSGRAPVSSSPPDSAEPNAASSAAAPEAAPASEPAAAPAMDPALADPFTRRYSLAELQEDFRQFQHLVEYSHPKLYADRAEIAAMLEAGYGRLDEGMTELKFLRLLAPIVSRLNCGHSSLSLSRPYQDKLAAEGLYFPLLLRFIGGKAWVVGNGLHPEIPAGAELLSINGQPMAAIVARLLGSLSADGLNQTRKYAFLNGWFRYSYQNFIDERGAYDIAFRSEASPLTQYAFLTGLSDEAIRRANQAYFSAWQERYAKPYEAAFQGGYACLTMRSFYPQGSYSLSAYKKFTDDFFARVKAEGIASVLLDLRDNSGGDPYVAAHLFSYLASEAQAYFADSAPGYYPSLKRVVPLAERRFEGRLLILMNGDSFSTTGHLLALLRSQGVGAFIGEESGGSYVCSDASQTYTLSRTGLRFRGSTMVWEVAAKGLEPGRGIMPDHPVEPSIADWLSGRDTVMEYAVKLAKRP